MDTSNAELEDEWTDLDIDEFSNMTGEPESMLQINEEIKTVNLGDAENVQEICIVKGPEEEQIQKLCHEFKEVFAWTYRDMPGLDPSIATHKIPINEDAHPVKQKLRRMRPDIQNKVKQEIVKLLEAGFIRVANYPDWVANIVPVPKKGGKIRICIDYRDLNKASPKDDFPIPHIDMVVDSAAKHLRLSLVDGYSGYNQILMDETDQEKTTFITIWGTFCYRVMSMGLKNAGATYQRAMITLFHDMVHQEVEVYIDDMVIKSREDESHVDVLRKVFERLKKYRLRLNPSKCIFGASSGKLLGFMVSNRGIEIDPEKIKAIRDLAPPRTPKEVRSFMGRVNFVARFISNLTQTCDPIFKLLRKNVYFQWTDQCQDAFDKIKTYLLSPPVLVPPIPGKPLVLYLTVLDQSLGAMLAQHDDQRKEHAIYYVSKKFTEGESRYPTIEKTCCALAWTVFRLKHYTLNHTTFVISRLDPIKYLLETPYLHGRLAKWQVILSQYDLRYAPKRAIKGSIIADQLAESPTESEYVEIEFPDENLVSTIDAKEERIWEMYFDGAVNSSGNGIGAVLVSPDDEQFPIAIQLQFNCTNNMAEYEACICGLQAAINMRIKKLQVYGDSALIIFQTKGDWKTRDSKLIPYQKLLAKLINSFEEIDFHHLSREKNMFADALATLASMIKVESDVLIKPLSIEVSTEPTCNMMETSDSLPWYHDLAVYISKQTYPLGATENEKRTIRRLSQNFYWQDPILYKRGFNGELLRCIYGTEIELIIRETHEGVCSTHANGHSLARQILRRGYYWTTMETDCIQYVRRCQKCQIYADNVNAPPAPLHTQSAPWPFAVWGMDIIGQITPHASNGHRFILVAIDYFTKWVEAASYKNVTQKVVARFLKVNIICRYGVPDRIITDNGSNLNGSDIQKICEQFKITHHRSTPYRPQMNGAVEAANKNLKKILQKMTETYKDWHEKLPFALMGYRTSVRTSTGYSPFALVYGTEAVVPIEVEIPSLRIVSEAKLSDSEWNSTRFEQLNLIEEKRLRAISHGQLYQARIARAFNKRVRPRTFKPGDLVLRKIRHILPDPRGKWVPNYKGPYIVKQAFSGGALILTDMDGKIIAEPVNSDAVKMYFP